MASFLYGGTSDGKMIQCDPASSLTRLDLAQHPFAQQRLVQIASLNSISSPRDKLA